VTTNGKVYVVVTQGMTRGLKQVVHTYGPYTHRGACRVRDEILREDTEMRSGDVKASVHQLLSID